MKEENKKEGLLKEILGDVIFLAIVLIVTFLLIAFVGQRTQVSGTSMEPTLQHGDNLITDKITYRFREPERFDIVVFPVPAHDGSGKEIPYIKRIIGLPGETVYIDAAGVIYINGEELPEGYGKEVIAAEKGDWRQWKLRWARMNILFWEITVTTVRTAGVLWSAM